MKELSTKGRQLASEISDGLIRETARLYERCFGIDASARDLTDIILLSCSDAIASTIAGRSEFYGSDETDDVVEVVDRIYEALKTIEAKKR